MKSVPALALLLAAPAFCATVLWDQAPITPTALSNQVFTDYPEFSTYVLSDVTVPSSGWIIESLTSYFSAGTFFAASGYHLPVQLVILPASGDLPDAAHDPGTAAQYDGVYTFTDDMAAIEIRGLSIALAPGDYWVGMSAFAAYGYEGQFYLLSSASTVGRPAAWRNPGGGFGHGTDWVPANSINDAFADGNLHIEGTLGSVPEPATVGTLALALLAVGGLRLAHRNARNSPR